MVTKIHSTSKKIGLGNTTREARSDDPELIFCTAAWVLSLICTQSVHIIVREAHQPTLCYPKKKWSFFYDAFKSRWPVIVLTPWVRPCKPCSFASCQGAHLRLCNCTASVNHSNITVLIFQGIGGCVIQARFLSSSFFFCGNAGLILKSRPRLEWFCIHFKPP